MAAIKLAAGGGCLRALAPASLGEPRRIVSGLNEIASSTALHTYDEVYQALRELNTHLGYCLAMERAQLIVCIIINMIIYQRICNRKDGAAASVSTVQQSSVRSVRNRMSVWFT